MMADPIKFLYTKNSKIGSKLIRFASKYRGQKIDDVPSHFSILIYEWLVIESTLGAGVKIGFIGDFLPKHDVLACFRPKNNQREYFQRTKSMTSRIYNKSYDFMGAIYLGFFQMLNTHFGVKMPERNKFDSANRYFCNELYGYISGKDMSMEHPNSLMLEMERNEKFTRVEL